LTPAQAVKVAAHWGLQIHCSSDEGIIYSQIPDPGTLAEKGDEIKLIIRTESMAKNGIVNVPDLRGLSIREARRLLLACGLESAITGYGTVRNQHPRPGKSVKRGYTVSLECRPNISIDRPEEHDLAGRGSR
jgi:beta-lactam-binding protein with PASTA domain